MLTSVIDRIAERFAATNGTIGSRRVLRERTDNLILDLLAALRSASLSEIAETTQTLDRRRKSRATASVPVDGLGTGANKPPRAPTEPRQSAEDSAPRSVARDPFDITKPMELLDPVAGEAHRDGDPPASVRRFREEAPAAQPGTVGSGTDSVLASEGLAIGAAEGEGARQPGIALRDGEQLLRSGGSGAVIRRVRGV